MKGILQKMRVEHASPVRYFIRLGDDEFLLNDALNKKISIHFSGNIFCVQCGRKTNKSFQQGFCFPCCRRLQECDMCVIHPERCHVEKEGCPEDDWAHQQCHQQHVIYLANSSALKVGITRHNHVPSRWIDQGARQALPIFTASNRYQSGLVEVAMKQYVADKTNWRAMLKQDAEPIDLLAERKRLLKKAENDIAAVIARYSNNEIQPVDSNDIVDIEYPVMQYPEKIKSHSLDKTPVVEGVLQGIKGQYILLDGGVMNIRKFGGYDVEFSVE